MGYQAAFAIGSLMAALSGGGVSWLGERFILPAIPSLALDWGMPVRHARVLGRILRVQWHLSCSGGAAPP
jgi:hypothetical protein